MQNLSINAHILQLYISTDSITHNFSCTDVNNNLQLKTAELYSKSETKSVA